MKAKETDQEWFLNNTRHCLKEAKNPVQKGVDFVTDLSENPTQRTWARGNKELSNIINDTFSKLKT